MEIMKLSDLYKYVFLWGNFYLNISMYMYVCLYDMKVYEGLLGGRKGKGEEDK